MLGVRQPGVPGDASMTTQQSGTNGITRKPVKLNKKPVEKLPAAQLAVALAETVSPVQSTPNELEHPSEQTKQHEQEPLAITVQAAPEHVEPEQAPEPVPVPVIAPNSVDTGVDLSAILAKHNATVAVPPPRGGRAPVRESTVQKPVKLVHAICAEMYAQRPEVTRKEIVEACEKVGIATCTARTQYQIWSVARRSDEAAAKMQVTLKGPGPNLNATTPKLVSSR